MKHFIYLAKTNHYYPLCISIILIVTALLNTSCRHQSNDKKWIAEAPAGMTPCQIDKSGITVIPNGRLITPLGKSITVAPHPYGLKISKDGSIAVTANSGVNPLSVSVIKGINTKNPVVMQIPPGPVTDKGVLASVFMGLALSPDNSNLYVAGGQENKVFIFSTATGEKKGFISCADSLHPLGYIGDMILTKDGKRIYAVDQTNFRLLILNTETHRLIRSVPTGIYPFGIALSPDEKRLYVANVGVYEYSKVYKKVNDSLKETLLDYPAYAYNSKISHEGIDNDSLLIPPLGDPNSPKSFSVWSYDIAKQDSVTILSKIKTGVLVGKPVEGIPAVGGASPNSLVANDSDVFVSNGTNDNISVIDIQKDTVVHTIHLTLDKHIDHLRGKIPFGLALSPDNKRLYVAEAGINAVGVIDTRNLKLLGHIPTGWFPAKLAVTPDGKQLIVANAKGYGSGPNGGKNFQIGPGGSYIGSLMKGTVSIINIPEDSALPRLSRKVIENNFLFKKITKESIARRKDNPIPLFRGQKKSPIKHIVFISKENRTFDEVLGQLKNVNGDPSLARFGYHVTFYNRNRTDSVIDANIMVNHLKLAKEFAVCDNFYVDSDVSADGHRWLVNTYPNEWVESTVPANYGGNRNYKKAKGTKGAFGFDGSSGSLYPEDYNETGSLWEHLDRHNISFYNFGFTVMFEPADYNPKFTKLGLKFPSNVPLPAPLYNKTSRTYPSFNTGIPDQFRINGFIKEFDQKWINGTDTLPSLITVIIPNDHGAGERPADGYPFLESYMADNDLAVGRIVEFLSHTRYWKNMLIIITEDDAQSGVDHVDAHRSILLAISPWVKRKYAGHYHYSFGSIFKTFWNILGIPYLNEYDATATDMSDLFTDTPDFQPYNALPVDKRVFDPRIALTPLDENFDWKAVKESPEMDNVEDMLRESKEQDKDRLENREK